MTSILHLSLIDHRRKLLINFNITDRAGRTVGVGGGNTPHFRRQGSKDFVGIPIFVFRIFEGVGKFDK